MSAKRSAQGRAADWLGAAAAVPAALAAPVAAQEVTGTL